MKNELKQKVLMRTTAASSISSLLLTLTVMVVIMNKPFQRNTWTATMIVFALIAGVYLGMDKTLYLPFLSETVIPPSLLKDGTPKEATMSLTLDNAPSGATKCMYWASKLSESIENDPWKAYDTYQNSGVVDVQDGMATLILDCPARYRVPRKRDPLPKHVHYRWVFPSGLVSEVKTQNVSC
jgi:hypothetical protein